MLNVPSPSSARTTKPKPAEALPPLTPEQREMLLDVIPLVRGVAGKVASKWGADKDDVKGQAMIFAADAVRDFDGRGNLRGFVGQRVQYRLHDELKRERRRQPRGSLTFDENDPHCENAAARKCRQDDPARPLLFIDAVAAVRGCLSRREIEILKLRYSGIRTEEIASKFSITPRRVQQLLNEASKRIEQEANNSALSPSRIVEPLAA